MEARKPSEKPNRREFLIGLGVSVVAATVLSPMPLDGRAMAFAAGLDPDEIVSYGPPAFFGDNDPVEREAPIWMLLDPEARKRLP